MNKKEINAQNPSLQNFLIAEKIKLQDFFNQILVEADSKQCKILN